MLTRIAGPALAVLVLLLAAIPAYVLVHWDDPPIDDSDLRLERSVLAPGTNGVELLDSIAALTWWPDERAQELDALRREEPWDDALAVEALARNEAALARIPELLAAPHFQVRAPVWKDGVFTGGESMQWTRPSRALALRSLAHARAGRAEAAFEDARSAIEIGARLQRAEGATLLAYLVGSAGVNLGVEALERGLPHLAPTDRQSRRWTAALGSLQAGRNAWIAMWGVEYEYSALLMDRLREEASAAADRESDPLESVPYLFKPNATKERFASFYRGMRARGGGRCVNLELPVPQPPEGAWEKARFYLRPNSVGRILFQIAAPNVLRYEAQRCAGAARLASARAAVALRAYEVEHGTLPDALEELVPRHLAAVPIDPFDGEPLAYDPAARALGRERPDLTESCGSPSRFGLSF